MPIDTVTKTGGAIVHTSPVGTCVELHAAETPEQRTVAGLVLPFGEEGRTTGGVLVVHPGTVSLPADLGEVKLLDAHVPQGSVIGHAIDYDVTDDGLRMTFQVGTNAEAEAAITSITERRADAFSAELRSVEKTGMHVHSALLKAVALVPFPAFPSARVSDIHAEESNTNPENPMPIDDVIEQPRSIVVPQPATPTPPVEVHASLTEVVDHIAAVRRGEANFEEFHAELTDITLSGLTNATAPQWLGELWSGVTYKRRVIDHLTHRPLTGKKARGWRWKTEPTVQKYSGDKAEIPTSAVQVEAVERDAERWASGNDIDRAFYDFGETEILESYWRAMAKAYAIATDAEATTFLTTNAVSAGETANILEGITTAALNVLEATDNDPTFVLVNPKDSLRAFAFKEKDAPLYLDMVPVAHPKHWTKSKHVPQGTVIVGTKPAVEFFELAGSPLRVEAEHIAKGGRDVAIFGYTSALLVMQGGVQKFTLSEA